MPANSPKPGFGKLESLFGAHCGSWMDDGPTGSYSGPDPFWEFLCLSFSTFLAVSKGASQGQSIYLILRPTVAQKRTVSKEVFWYASDRVTGNRRYLDPLFRLARRSQWVDATLARSPLAGASTAKNRSRALIQTKHHPG